MVKVGHQSTSKTVPDSQHPPWPSVQQWPATCRLTVNASQETEIQQIVFTKNTFQMFPASCELGHAVANFGAMLLHTYHTCYHHPPLTAVFIQMNLYLHDG